MENLSPLLSRDFVRGHNYLQLQHGEGSQILWQKAQTWCLGFASYCSENGLPPQAVAYYYGVRKKCDNYQQAAFFAAANVVRAYQDAGMGGDS
ncbi:hypothetical protein N9359_04490 [Luminiphilus sp.]|nr:hypothetical protein [Luminiphilus sp.]